MATCTKVPQRFGNKVMDIALRHSEAGAMVVCLSFRPPTHFQCFINGRPSSQCIVHVYQRSVRASPTSDPLTQLFTHPHRQKINRRPALPMQAIPSNRSGSLMPYRSRDSSSTVPSCLPSYYPPTSVEPLRGLDWWHRGWFSLFQIYLSSGTRSAQILGLGFVWRRLDLSMRLRCCNYIIIIVGSDPVLIYYYYYLGSRFMVLRLYSR